MTEIPSDSSSMVALKAHDNFFARIIEMIPVELYRHSLSEDGDGAENTKYYKHRKLPLTADEKKVLSKQKKADKYAAPLKKTAAASDDDDDDEDDSNVEKSESEDEEEDDEDEENLATSTNDNISIPVLSSSGCNDIDTLRERLQQRIQGMRGDRTSSKPHKVKAQETAAAKKEQRDKQDKAKASKNKKRKSGAGAAAAAEDSTAASGAEAGATTTTTTGTSRKAQKTAEGDSAGSSSNSDGSAAATSTIESDLEFSKMLTIHSAPAAGTDKNKGKPGSKVQRLKRLLEESQYKRAKLASMAKSENPAEQAALAHSKWSDTLKHAAGESKAVLVVGGSGSSSGGVTMLDAEAKLKKAIKRKEKAKQKSAAEWKARIDAVEESKTSRINKREENILGRKNQKLGLLVPDPKKDNKEEGGKNANNNVNNTKGNNAHVNKEAATASGGGKGRAGFEGKKKSGEFLNSGGGGGKGGGKANNRK